jgi:hypothetical protein
VSFDFVLRGGEFPHAEGAKVAKGQVHSPQSTVQGREDRSSFGTRSRTTRLRDHGTTGTEVAPGCDSLAHHSLCFGRPNVPPTNNQAERSLRPVVITRKVIQGLLLANECCQTNEGGFSLESGGK